MNKYECLSLVLFSHVINWDVNKKKKKKIWSSKNCFRRSVMMQSLDDRPVWVEGHLSDRVRSRIKKKKKKKWHYSFVQFNSPVESINGSRHTGRSHSFFFFLFQFDCDVMHFRLPSLRLRIEKRAILFTRKRERKANGFGHLSSENDELAVSIDRMMSFSWLVKMNDDDWSYLSTKHDI